MRKGGSIINTCSIQAFDPIAHLPAYAATKAALVNLTKGMSFYPHPQLRPWFTMALVSYAK